MPQVRKPEVHDRILAAGLEAFTEHGYDGATMAAIARRAGVATANLYRYVDDKAALFDAVVPDELVAEHDRLLDARVGALTEPVGSTETADALLAFWVEHRLAVALLLDHRGTTSRSAYARSFVVRLVDLTRVALDRPLTATELALLELVFDNTRRAIATILRSTDDPGELRTRIEGFWSYQLPGLDGLVAWMG